MIILALVIGLPSQALGQKRTERGKNDKTDSGETSGPKRTDRTIPESERVKVITKTEFIRVAVNPNKGYLSIVAHPSATVALIPLPVDPKKDSTIKETIKDQDGSLNLINLLPGKYKLVIEHPDYHTYTDNIQIDPARPETLVAANRMVSKYGSIRIGGAPADARVFLDDAAIGPPRLQSDSQSAFINRVPVGKHRLKITKPGYVEFNEEIDVLPDKASFVSAQLDLALVTLNLSSHPGARVYVGNQEKANVPSGGTVAISLAPGRHSILISKEGYQDWRKEFTLSLANNPVTERAELIPIPTSAEGDWGPALGARKWHPQPAAWRVDATGALIKGDQLIMFDTEPSREFNTYRDFKLEFDVVFTNGKGVSWAARAKDPKNYYLFEISSPPNATPTFHFYICRDGNLQWLDSRPIVENMNKPGESFHITFEARGGRFDTRMTLASAPSAQPHLIGIFQDDTLSYGGVGFRGKDLSESLLQSFFVIPLQ